MKRLLPRSALLVGLALAIWLVGPQTFALGDFGFDFGIAHAKGGDDGGSDDDGGNSGSGGGSDDSGGGGNSGSGSGSDDDDDSGGNSGKGGGDDDDDRDDGNSGSGGGNDGGSVSGGSGDQSTLSVGSVAGTFRNGFVVRFRDGHIEAIRDGYYVVFDRRGRLIDQRRANAADKSRLESLRLGIRQSDDIDTIAVIGSSGGLIRVIDTRGWTEILESGTYMLLDPDGNRVKRRKATSRDRSRLATALP